AALAEVGEYPVLDPALLVDLARVDVLGGVVSERADEAAHLVGLGLVREREREHQLLVDLAEHHRLGEGRDVGRSGCLGLAHVACSTGTGPRTGTGGSPWPRRSSARRRRPPASS